MDTGQGSCPIGPGRLADTDWRKEAEKDAKIVELGAEVEYWWAMAEHYRQLKEMHRAQLFAVKGLKFHAEALK